MRKDAQPPAEANLAERIRREREATGLSLEGLARLMTDAGQPTHGSAIFKIERGQRRITVAELVALAAVLEVEPGDLLTPVELLDKARAEEVLSSLQQAGKNLEAVVVDLLNLYVVYHGLAEEDPEIYEYVRGHHQPSEWGIIRNLPDGTQVKYPWPRLDLGRMPADIREEVETLESFLVSYAFDATHGKEGELSG